MTDGLGRTSYLMYLLTYVNLSLNCSFLQTKRALSPEERKKRILKILGKYRTGKSQYNAHVQNTTIRLFIKALFL